MAVQQPHLVAKPVEAPIDVVVLDTEPERTRPSVPAVESERTSESGTDRTGGYPGVREQGWQQTFAAKADTARGSSQTLAGWLFAVSPLWAGALIITATAVLSFINPFLVQAAVGLVGFVATLLLAREDARRLARRGYQAPSPWWALLPLLYCVVRAARVGTRGVGIVVTYLLSCVALIALLYLTVVSSPLLLSVLVPPSPTDSSAIPTPVATLTAAQRADQVTDSGVEAQLRSELTATFTVGDVSCVPFANLEAGTTTTCVVNLDGLDYNAGLQLTPDDPSTAFVLTGMIPVAG